MESTAMSPASAPEMRSPVRNRYFYGKLLDAYHFELETNYLNLKRWLHNRLVSGHGVVCGLDVRMACEGTAVVVTPGHAVDRWGREIIVPRETPPVPIPPEVAARSTRLQGEECNVIQVLLCYHECLSDPVPVLTADCPGEDRCAPGAIRERYRISFKEGGAPPIATQVRHFDFITGGDIDYSALATFVTRGCPEPPADPCITLANLHVTHHEEKRGGGCYCEDKDIDITVRPIVYGNDLLFDLFVSLLTETPKYRGGKSS